MKFVILCTLVATHLCCFSQKKSIFSSLDSIDVSPKEIRVILTSADWCKICQANKSELEKSEKLKAFYSDYVDFYEIEENIKDSITFNGKVYSSRQIDERRSEHSFLLFLFEHKTISYPTFFFINSKNEVVYRYSGYLKENEIDELLHSLLANY